MSRRPPPPSDKALQGLAKYRDTLAKNKRRAIEKAIRHLRKTNAPVNSLPSPPAPGWRAKPSTSIATSSR